MENTNNNRPAWINILLIVLAIVTVLAIIVGTVGRFTDLKIPFIGKTTLSPAETGEYVITEEITALDIDLDFGEVYIVEGSSPKVEYEFSPEITPSFSMSNGVLTVGTGANVNIHVGSLSDLNNMKAKLTITVPAGSVLSEITVDADMGNVVMKGISATSLFLACDMGNVTMTDCTADMFDAECDMGNITSKNMKFIEGQLDCDMGNITVSGDFDKLTADCSMGNITINTDRPESEVELHLESDMGNVKVNGNKR